MSDEPRCPYCEEPVRDEDDARIVPHLADDGTVTPRPWHPECLMRSIVGGLNHLRGRCTCRGGVEPPDPPWLSKREAARVAVAAYRALQ